MNVIYHLQRGLLIFISGLTLASCSLAGDAVKEGALSLVSFDGADTFTLRGTLPANFKIKAEAYYGSTDGACSARGDGNTYKSTQDNTPHSYEFKIPVSYHKGLCTLTLARVALYTTGRYGEKDWQETYDNGGIRLVDPLPANAPGFSEQGELLVNSQCTWNFQISKLYLELGKLLNCKNLGAYVVGETLPEKVLTLNINENSEEEPYMNGYWLKTQSGWKPCTGRWGTDYEELCTSPPKFRTFRMNDQECSVYPNCTE
ncbi:hypothetical protein [Pseudomonas sp. RL_15y_Pfl2_60]|uniref:hypothetical protein n=1 Tax=Pseudomonas sp. RL_15y_Pfl2_60 TaxID=3088709 RepID=UPI0030DDA745